MSHVIRTDKHGAYIRFNGQIFRPLFPIDYPPRKGGDKTGFAEGTPVKCTHKVHTPFAIVESLDEKDIGETWFAHGSYMQYHVGGYLPSTECYKPHGFTWAGGINK